MINEEEKKEQLTPQEDMVILDGTQITRSELVEKIKEVKSGATIRYMKMNESGLHEYKTLQRLMD